MRIGSLYGADWSAKLRRCPVCRREFMAGNAWVYKLDHGHIYSMVSGLKEAGAELKYVWDPDPDKVAAFLRRNPEAKAARCEEEVLEDGETRLIAAAAVVL